MWQTIQTKAYRASVQVSISLAFFRIIFGLLMALGFIRFMAKGWVYELYILPKHYFPFYGFEWVTPLPPWAMYVVFTLLIILSLLLVLGLWYRCVIIAFFLLFTYVELIDKTNYLNHYYFISLLSFLMIFMPMNATWVWKRTTKPVANYYLWMLQAQVGLVYVLAGIAKLKYDWLFEAMPLKIWLPANSHIPILGSLLQQTWVAYPASWFAALFDLSIPFLLINKKTRIGGYILVVLFHLLTAQLFYIGMFPYIMMMAVLVFFPVTDILLCLNKLGVQLPEPTCNHTEPQRPQYGLAAMFSVFIFIQLCLPFRYLLYPNKLLWSEEGYRFSWNVMLMEKTGFCELKAQDRTTGKEWIINQNEYLTKQQQRMVSTQPDMILQFAHIVQQEEQKKGHLCTAVFAECYVSLNGRQSRLLIDPNVNLASEKDEIKSKKWIMPYPY